MSLTLCKLVEGRAYRPSSRASASALHQRNNLSFAGKKNALSSQAQDVLRQPSPRTAKPRAHPMSVRHCCKCHFRNVELATEYYGTMRGSNVTNSVHLSAICLNGPREILNRSTRPSRKDAPEASEPARLLLFPGFSTVGAAPDLVVTGGNYDLRRATNIAAKIDVSYVGTKLLTFDGRLHLRPS